MKGDGASEGGRERETEEGRAESWMENERRRRERRLSKTADPGMLVEGAT